jgi:hypothetical protein
LQKIKKAGLASGLDGDEVKYAFTQALRRAARPTWGRCPSRAASKTSMPTLNGQRNFHQLSFRRICAEKVQIFFKNLLPCFMPFTTPTNARNLNY